MKAIDLTTNFIPEDSLGKDLVWLDVLSEPFTVHGVSYDERQGKFVRMPQSVADNTSDMVSCLNTRTAGGRVKFRTDSKYIAIHAVLFDEDNKRGLSQSDHGFDLCQKRDCDPFSIYAYSFVPDGGTRRGFSGGYGTDGSMTDYTVHMPTGGEVLRLYVGLSPDAEVLPATPYTNERPVVFYGSSITQGAGASRPANIYENIISRHLNMDFVNLGFGGSCLGEDAVVDHISGLDMSIFVCDYDHNAPGEEHLKKTHLPIYRKVRAKNPELPIVFISAPNIMPDYTWHIPRRDVIRATYETAKLEGDENVYFIDGETFFDIPDRDMCTIDTCHPNDLGMILMATKIEAVLKEIFEKK